MIKRLARRILRDEINQLEGDLKMSVMAGTVLSINDKFIGILAKDGRIITSYAYPMTKLKVSRSTDIPIDKLTLTGEEPGLMQSEIDTLESTGLTIGKDGDIK